MQTINNLTTKEELLHPNNIIFAFFAAICGGLAQRVHFRGNVYDSVAINFIGPVTGKSVVVFFFVLIVTYVILCLGEPLLFHLIQRLPSSKNDSRSIRRILIFWAIVLILWWSLYFLTYFPGGIYSDTFTSVNYASRNYLTNRHPFLYNCIVWVFVHLGYHFDKTITWSMAMLYGTQMLAMGTEILLFIYWMVKRNVNRILRIAVSCFFVFFNLIPMYAVSVWKDTPFCMAVLFWEVFTVDLYLESRKGKISGSTMTGFLLGLFLTAFTRNNGIYVCAFTAFVMLLAVRGQKKAKLLSCLAVVICFAVQGPGYRLVGIDQTEPVENFGIPLQQIGAVMAYDGNMTEEQKAIVDRIFAGKSDEAVYAPALADNLKWYSPFDSIYFNNHIGEFLRLWVELFFQNPKLYVDAYLYETLGYWDFEETCGAAYAQNYVWDNIYGVEGHDLLEAETGYSLKTFFDPYKHMISNAIFFWIQLLGLLLTAKRFGWRTSFLFASVAGVWLSVMVATPIAFSLRYVAPLMFNLPFVLLIPHMIKNPET